MNGMIPTRKVGVGTLAGALVVVLIKISKDAFGYDIDAELAAALTVLVTFAVSYLIPEASQESAGDVTSKQGGFVSVSMLMVITMLVSLVMLAGCGTQQGRATERALVSTGVRIAVRHWAADNPRAAAKADNIRQVLTKAQSIATADTPIAGVEALVRKELSKIELSPLDRADADDLMNLLASLGESLKQEDGEAMDGFVNVGQFLDLVLSALPAAPTNA